MHHLVKLFFVIVITISVWFFASYGKEASILYGDAEGYYRYLPHTFVYNNLDSIEYLPSNRGIDERFINEAAGLDGVFSRSAKGNLIIIYTYAVALTQAPFFAVVHAYQKFMGLPANGWDVEYQNALKVANIFYAILGLFFLYGSLAFFYRKNIAIISTLLIYIATNLFWFSLIQAGMSHIPLFALYAILIYYTICLHYSFKLKHFIIVGFTCGLICIMRPSDALCILIPLFYGVTNKASLINKLQLIKMHYLKIVLALIVFCIPILPQLIYWKIYAGTFFYNSYIGNTFNFSKPHILEGLFNGENGWLAYTPIMAFALLGLFLLKKQKQLLLATLIYLPIYIYVIYSWWCFQYINGFGSRPMIHCYPLLAFGLAALLQHISTSKKWLQYLISSAFMFCIVWNVGLSRLQARGMLWAECANVAFNFNSLFKSSLSYSDLLKYDTKQYSLSNPQKEILATTIDAKDSTTSITDSNGTKYFKLLGSSEYGTPGLNTTFNKSLLPNTKYLKCSGLFRSTNILTSIYSFHSLVMQVTRGGKGLEWQQTKIDNKLGTNLVKCTEHYPIQILHSDLNVWDEVYFYIKLKEPLQDGDNISVYVWNVAKTDLEMQNLKLFYCN